MRSPETRWPRAGPGRRVSFSSDHLLVRRREVMGLLRTRGDDRGETIITFGNVDGYGIASPRCSCGGGRRVRGSGLEDDHVRRSFGGKEDIRGPADHLVLGDGACIGRLSDQVSAG